MTENAPFNRIDPQKLEQIQQAERPALRIRWWFVLPLALLLSASQAVFTLLFEFSSLKRLLTATQIPLMGFTMFFLLCLAINPLLRLWWPATLLALAAFGEAFIRAVEAARPDTVFPGQWWIRIVLVCLAGFGAIRLLIGRNRRAWTPAVIAGAALIFQILLMRVLPPWAAWAVAQPRWIAAWQSVSNSHILFTGVALAQLLAALFVLWILPGRIARLVAGGLLLVAVIVSLSSLWAANIAGLWWVAVGLDSCIIAAIFSSLLANRPDSYRSFMNPFNRGELMALFGAVFVTGGICTFGLADQLIPLVAMPYNPDFNQRNNWDKDVHQYLNKGLFIQADAPVPEPPPNADGTPRPTPTFFAQYWTGVGREAPGLWKQIPWLAWAKPLALWMIFILAIYALFYSLCMLLYDSWARREKLVFPLARLPESLMHDDGAPPGSLSSTVVSTFFWLGFGFVFVLYAYNAACQAGWIRGLTSLPLGVDWWQVRNLVAQSIFKGIADGAPMDLSFIIIFVAVGIGFLLPLEISASLWIYRLIGVGMVMIAMWTAAGASTKDFPTDWLWQNNFVTALGAGGFLAYAVVILAKLFIERAQKIRDEMPDAGLSERAVKYAGSFGWGGVIFMTSLLVAIGWLWWSRVPPLWGAVFIAIIILITVCLMRIVAEGGIYWFQVHTGPFHLAKMAGGPAHIPAGVMAVLMPVYSVLFLDIKTFMAPAVMNSFKMQEESRASRRWFHTIIVLAIVFTVFVSLAVMLYLVYRIGAGSAHSWFFQSGPAGVFNSARLLIKGTFSQTGKSYWILYLLGAGWLVLSIAMRRRFFWWLHPIGFVMLPNPLMGQMGFSFFVGWLCKKIAVRYGGRHMFAQVRPLFIGLFMGEIVACMFWALIGAWLNIRIGIDLNR